jgi:hypothetical protein
MTMRKIINLIESTNNNKPVNESTKYKAIEFEDGCWGVADVSDKLNSKRITRKKCRNQKLFEWQKKKINQ